MFFDIKKLKEIVEIKEGFIQFDENNQAAFQSALINNHIELEITQDMIALNTQPVIRLTYQQDTIQWLEKQIAYLNGCLLNIDLMSLLEENSSRLTFYQSNKQWLLPFFYCVLSWLKEQENLLPQNQPMNDVVKSNLTWEKFN